VTVMVLLSFGQVCHVSVPTDLPRYTP
jgi:hypothetical protein